MATILTLQPDASAGMDTFVLEHTPGGNYYSAAYIGVSGAAGARRIGLVKFDLSDIPAGSTIQSAVFYLYGGGSGFNGNFYLNRILPANSGWTEAGATWNYAVNGVTRWAGDAASNGGTDAGCSISGTDYSSTLLGTMAYERVLGTENFAALNVDEFALMLADNYGFVVRDQSSSGQVKQPFASDYATAAYRPKLVVNYTAPVVVVPDLPELVGVTAPQFLSSEQNFPFTC